MMKIVQSKRFWVFALSLWFFGCFNVVQALPIPPSGYWWLARKLLFGKKQPPHQQQILKKLQQKHGSLKRLYLKFGHPGWLSFGLWLRALKKVIATFARGEGRSCKAGCRTCKKIITLLKTHLAPLVLMQAKTLRRKINFHFKKTCLAVAVIAGLVLLWWLWQFRFELEFPKIFQHLLFMSQKALAAVGAGAFGVLSFCGLLTVRLKKPGKLNILYPCQECIDANCQGQVDELKWRIDRLQPQIAEVEALARKEFATLTTIDLKPFEQQLKGLAEQVLQQQKDVAEQAALVDGLARQTRELVVRVDRHILKKLNELRRKEIDAKSFIAQQQAQIDGLQSRNLALSGVVGKLNAKITKLQARAGALDEENALQKCQIASLEAALRGQRELEQMLSAQLEQLTGQQERSADAQQIVVARAQGELARLGVELSSARAQIVSQQGQLMDLYQKNILAAERQLQADLAGKQELIRLKALCHELQAKQAEFERKLSQPQAVGGAAEVAAELSFMQQLWQAIERGVAALPKSQALEAESDSDDDGEPACGGVAGAAVGLAAQLNVVTKAMAGVATGMPGLI